MSGKHCLLLLPVLCLAGAVLAAEPIVLTHQGRLLDAEGQPVANGSHSVTYLLYADSVDGSPLWSEARSVVTTDGLFSAMLGASVTLADSLFRNGPRYLEVQIGGVVLQPRLQLASVAHAAVARGVSGDFESDAAQITITPDGLVGSGFVLDGSRSIDDGVIERFTWTQTGGPYKFSTRQGALEDGAMIEVSSEPSGSSGGGMVRIQSSPHKNVVQLLGRGSSGLGDTTGQVAISADTSGSVYRGEWLSSDAAVKRTAALGTDTAGSYWWLEEYDLTASTVNPLYENKGTSGTNVLYERSAGSGENPLYEHSSSARENALYEHTGAGGQSPLYESRSTARGVTFVDSLSELETTFDAQGVSTKTKSDVGPIRWMAPESLRLRNTAGGGGSGGAILLATEPQEAKVTVRGWDPDRKIVILADDASGESSIEFQDPSGVSAVRISDIGLSRLAGHLSVGTDQELATLTVGGDICATGAIGACSDLRYKRDVHPLADALETVAKIQGIGFNWQTEQFPQLEFSDAQQVGFIAQELKEVLPEVVAQSSNGYYTVDYGKLTPLLVEAIKELRLTNERKDVQINALARRLEHLEKMVLEAQE